MKIPRINILENVKLPTLLLLALLLNIAIFILIGSINLPIIKFSVDWWNTLHQPASVSKLSSPSIDVSMLQPLLTMTLTFSLIGIIAAILRIKAEILIRKKYL